MYGVENWRERWNYSYTVLLLCWFGWITIYLCRSVLAPLLPVITIELGLSHAQAGMLETAYLIGYIVIKVPAGLIANKIGIKRTLVIGMIGYALATMLNFFASNFFHLFFLRFFIGLFQGVHLPLANTLLSERFGEIQGRVIGFHESGPNVGNSIAYPLAVMIASSWSWRYAFLFISLPAFILAGVVTLILREEKEISRLSRSETSNMELKLSDYMSYLIPLAVAHATYNLCLRTLLTFAPSFLVEYRGMGLTIAGFVATLMPAAGFFAKVSSGFIAEKLGRKLAISIATSLSSILIFSLTMVSGQELTSLNFVILGLTLYSFSPTIYASVTSGLPTQLKSLGLGVVTMTGNIFGALSTSLIGYLIDILGYETAFRTISGLVVVATVLIYLGIKENPS